MTQTNLDRLKAYADAHAQLLTDNCSINPELYQTYGVKRGLRDQKGRGVLAAATLVMFLPNLVIFIFMQNKVLNTMAHSGIK